MDSLLLNDTDFIQFVSRIRKSFPTPEGAFVDNSIDVELLNLLTANDNSVKTVFDLTNFKALATSQNIEERIGITISSTRHLNEYLVRFTKETLVFLTKTNEWLYGYLKKDRSRPNFSDRVTICGLHYVTAQGENVRLMCRILPLKYDANGLPALCIASLDKVNHLMKSDTMWFRVEYGHPNRDKVVYTSSTEDTIGKANDIISSREKEILKLLSMGMDTKEIAETLFISTNTIIKHRKNMLARTGLCDTTALIQICQACGILK